MRIAEKGISKKGFTLMEMLVVVAILVIAAAIAIPFGARMVRTLRLQELDSKARIIYVAAQNRITELRAVGGQQLYSLESKSKPVTGDALRYVASKDGETDAFGIFGEDLVDNELWTGDWVIVFDSSSGNVKEVFYSEEALNYDPAAFDSYRDHDYRLGDGAKKGYYGGEPVDLSDTSSLEPKITIENGERLTAHLYCESSNPSGLSFEIKLTDSDGVSSNLTVTPEVFGSKASYDLVLDSLEDGGHFKERFPSLNSGGDILIELRAISSDRLIDVGSAHASANSLFSAVEGDTAIISSCRHLQNLDVETSGVGDFVKKAVQKSSLWFSDTPGNKDWFDTYGEMSFKPIYNPVLTSYEGSYISVKSVNQGGVEKLKEEIAATVIYDINIITTGGENAGLFRSLADNQALSLKNIYLCNASISAEYDSGNIDGCNAGGLVGCLGDSSGCRGTLTIEGCRVYLDKTRAVLSNQAYFDGGRVGGLVGAALGGELRITDSFAATVIGSKGSTASGGGLVGAAGKADIVISKSYADCYINAGNVGGLIGEVFAASTAGISLDNCYAAGYLIADSAAASSGGSTGAAGLVFGEVSGCNNSYTVCSMTVPESGEYYTTFKSGSAVTNTYFLETRKENAQPDVPNTQKASFLALNSLTDYASLFSGSEYTRTNSGLSSNPYNLKNQGLGDYSYPRLKNLPHYGDWQADFETGALVYYEEYADGSFGFFGANTDTLRDDAVIVGDGYAMVFASEPSISEAKITLDGGSETKVSFVASNKITVTSPSGDYILYTLPVEISDYVSISGSFYTKLRLDMSGIIKYYHFNPQFAKCITGGEEAGETPQPPSAIYLRSARHIAGLSINYQNIQAQTAGSTFVQERDISYSEYDWADYAKNGLPTEQKPIGSEASPFNAVYNGGGYTIDIDIPVKGGECAGFFGFNSGSIKDLKLRFSNTSLEQVGRARALGCFAGANSGTISGCALICGRLSGDAGAGESLAVGGFVGTNSSGGTITGCSAQTDMIKIASNGASIHIGGFVGENGGSIDSCYALSCVDAENNGGEAAAAGFASANTGNIASCVCASALLPRDYVGAYGFSFENSGTLTGCRYLGGEIYGYCEVVCPYNYQQNDSAALVDYDGLAAEQIPLFESLQDGKNSFSGWLDKPDTGTVGLYYWEKCPDGCHISFIGSSGGKGRHGSDLCNNPGCPGILDSGYGFYDAGGASIDLTEPYSSADGEISSKLRSILGESGYSAYIFGESINRDIEIKYIDGNYSFLYHFKADCRFADSFIYKKMSLEKGGVAWAEVSPAATELSDFAGRGDDFFASHTVRTLNQLQNVGSEPGSVFKLGHNIDGGGSSFTPIGDSSLPFSGSFDGGGFVIKKISIMPGFGGTGLFGCTSSADISGVTLIDSECYPNAGGSVGSIVGSADGGSIAGCLGGVRMNISGQSGLTIGGIVGMGSATVSDCTSVSGLSGYNRFGNQFFAVSGGGSVYNCYALDILCSEAEDLWGGSGVTFLRWGEMQTHLGVIPEDYPEGAVYWPESITSITNKTVEPNYIYIQSQGNTADWRFKLVSRDTEMEVYGVIVNRLSDSAISVTVTPEYLEVSGYYKLVAYTDSGLSTECQLIITPEIPG